MRKFLSIVVLFIFQNVFCQDYTFDIFLEYKQSNGNTNVFMINSFNQDYLFYCYNNSKDLAGKIIDRKNNIMHFYSIQNINNALKFNYLYSEKKDFIKNPCNFETEKFEVKKTEIDSLNQSIEIIEFTNKKKKRVYESATINLLKIDSKPLPNIVNGFFDHSQFCAYSNFPVGFIPKDIQINFDNKKREIKLLQNKKINMTLSLKPEDITYN